MSKKKKNLPIVLGLILVISSLSFIGYQQIRLSRQKSEAMELEKTFQASLKIELPKLELEAEVEEGDKVSGKAIGVVRIDKLGVIMPIHADTSNKSLIHGTGVVDTTDLPTSVKNTITVLAGHRGGRNENLSFINIDKLKNDDEVQVTTRDEILHYKVVGEEVVEATDWSKFIREDDKTKLFLMACHPYPKNDKRLLIKTELVGYTKNEQKQSQK